MAKGKSKEAVYTQQLQALGVYDPAFDGVIHMLCIQERELSRAMKAWAKTKSPDDKHPSITDPLYAEISRLRRDILSRQDALGLTPKALQRLRRQAAPPSESALPPASGNAAFTELLNTIEEATRGSAP